MKIKRKNSYYSKVFYGLLLVLLVAIVTFLSIFLQARNKVEKQILHMNQDTLAQTLQHVDEVVKSAADTTKSIAFSTQYISLSRRFVSEPQRHAYLAWALQQQLSVYSNETFFDVFVYYPENDYVISANNSYAKLENYFQYYYKHIDDSWDEFRHIANSPIKQPMMYSLNGKGQEAYQCVSLRMSLGSSTNMEYVVVVVLNQQYMKALLNKMRAYSEGRGKFFIMDKNKEVVFCTENEMVVQAIDLYQDTDEVYKRYIGDTSYMILSRKSNQMDIYYAYAVSSDYFWSELYDIYIIFAFGLFAMLILGVWIVFWQSKRIYRPVERTMTKLQQNSNNQWDVDMHTELEFIEMIFNSAQEDKKKLNVVMRQETRQRRNAFIASVLEGEVTDSEISEDIFAENGIQLCSDRFRVVLLKMEQSGSLDKSSLSFAVSNVLEELFSEGHRSCVVDMSTDRFAMLINIDSREGSCATAMLIDRAMRFWKENFNAVFTVGFSTEKQGLSGICDAYTEAVKAMKYRYLFGRGEVIDYIKIKDREFKWPQKDRMTYAFNDFMNEEGCDLSRAQAYVDECLQKYHINSSATLDMVECFVFEVVNNFNRYISRMGKEDTSWKEHIKMLPQSETLAEFQDNFAQLLMRVYLKLQEDEKENDICARAKSYIENHYRDVNLSLAELSNVFGLTPSYFSKMYKEKYKVSIPDYINVMRINQAKKLLRDTSQSVQLIAASVGFTESSTFIRIFKKIEGITPGVYRTLEIE